MLKGLGAFAPVVLLFGLLNSALASNSENSPLSTEPATETQPLPDMASITNTAEKKTTFFNYLRPIVDGINQKQAAERAWLKVMQANIKAGVTVSVTQQALLNELAQYYKVEAKVGTSLYFAQLFQRVDVIPVSLVLAQAANESAWGTSRFAVQGNNLFGQWCFSEGCGLVPEGREDGARHEVKVFDTISDSVAAYFRNLNTHYQYREFREIRSQYRNLGQPIDSTELAWGLMAYSSRGEAYIRELISMIEHNRLKNLDQPAFYAQNDIQIAID